MYNNNNNNIILPYTAVQVEMIMPTLNKRVPAPILCSMCSPRPRPRSIDALLQHNNDDNNNSQ